MKKTFILLLAILWFNLVTSAIATANEPPLVWEKTFGGSNDDQAYSVQQTSDGGYIIAGDTSSFGAVSSDVYVVKTDSAGNSVWEKTFGGSRDDHGRSVQQTADGGYIIAGYSMLLVYDERWQYYYYQGDVYLIKTDPDGNSIWQKTFVGSCDDRAYSVQQTTDGGYIIVGTTRDIGAPVQTWPDVYLIKTDSGGNMVWQKTFWGVVDDFGYSVQQTADGGYIIAGGTPSFGAGGYDVYLIKTDSGGNLVWQKTFGGSKYDQAYSVQQTTDGGYIVAGGTSSFGAGKDDVYLVKTDSAGNLVWQKTFGGSNDDFGNSVQQTTDGGYIIAGGTSSFGAAGRNVYLVKTDSGGNMVWQKTFGGSNDDFGNSVQQTTDGGYIIAGGTSSFGAGSNDVYLMKLGFEECQRWDFNCDGRVDFADFAVFAMHWLEERIL